MVEQGGVISAHLAALDLNNDDSTVVDEESLDDTSDHPGRDVVEDRQAVCAFVPVLTDEP